MSALALLLLASAPALPCGGFFHAPGDMAEQRTFQAIFEPGDGQVRVDYRVIYQGAAQDFGWVLPIPGAFLSLGDGEVEDFEALAAATDPELDLKEARDSGCMGGGSKDGGGLGDSGTGGTVEVVAQGFTGTYQYTVLEASGSQALLDWLSTHGWDVDASAEGIEAYVNEGGWQFVALALQAGHDEATDEDAFKLPPITLEYQGDRLAWPARLARYGMEGVVHTVLYVRGDQRARISGGWSEVAVPSLWDQGEDPDYMVNEAWPERLYEIGADQGFATVFAGPYEEGWVTRFEHRAPAEAFTADVDFAVDAGTEELHTVISNRGGCNKPAGAALLLVLPALGLLRRLGRPVPA